MLRQCQHCQYNNDPKLTVCTRCGKSMDVLPIERRTTILEEQIAEGITKGWALVTKDATTATMTKRGQANGCMVLILLCLAILPGVLYYYLARPTETIFIRVDEYGEVFRTKGVAQ